MSCPAIHIVPSQRRERPWLLMVHGVSQDNRLFSGQLNAFKHLFNLLLVDLPGHGGSNEVAGPFGLQEFASSLVKAQQKAGITRSHILGTHLGAGASLLLATQQPKRVESLLLEAPVLPGVTLTSVTTTLTTIRELAKIEKMARVREVWFQDSPWFDIIHKNPIDCREKEQWEIISDFSGKPWLDTQLAAPISSIEHELSNLNCPLLIVNGEHDLEDFKESAKQLNTLVTAAQSATIPGAGGFPLWEYPQRFNQVAFHFYQQFIEQ